MIDPTLARTAREAPMLGAEEERDLLMRARAGDSRARDRVVLAHLRLVLSEASKRKGYRVPLDDLVQEGTIGLVDAVDKFDLSQPVRFGTYAAFHIKAALTTAVMRGQSIVRRDTTADAKKLFFSLRRARLELERFGRLTQGEIVDQLATAFEVSPALIRTMSAHLSGSDSSLNVPVGESGDGSELGDFFVDGNPLPDEIVLESVDGERARETLKAALAILSDREREILAARRLVESEEEQTLEDLAERFGISRERVRQIEVRAIEKMRAFMTSRARIEQIECRSRVQDAIAA